MQTAGIIIEYNPMHDGHLYLLEQVREQLGADTAFVGVMSGNFVQRGDFALLRKHARARAAVENGVDLVLELPLPWAVSSAERFARGGVEILTATGVVTHLAFGSECGDAAALERLAAALHHAAFPALLRQELERGDSFAAARQRALAQLVSPEDAALVSDPNNILGVEYCKALAERASAVLKGGVVSYTDEVKHNVLGVPQALLDQYGAVSPQVAEAMARGTRRVLGCDLAVSTTGVAGPDPDDRGNPVGLVYVALAGAEFCHVQELHLGRGRAMVRSRTGSRQAVLQHLYSLPPDSEPPRVCCAGARRCRKRCRTGLA